MTPSIETQKVILQSSVAVVLQEPALVDAVMVVCRLLMLAK